MAICSDKKFKVQGNFAPPPGSSRVKLLNQWLSSSRIDQERQKVEILASICSLDLIQRKWSVLGSEINFPILETNTSQKNYFKVTKVLLYYSFFNVIVILKTYFPYNTISGFQILFGSMLIFEILLYVCGSQVKKGLIHA